MANDAEHERLRLTQRYAAMSDGELLNIADDFAGLTNEARAAISAELGKRGLKQPGIVNSRPPTSVMTDERIVTVARFMDMPQAMIAKSALEAAGIECFLAHENMNRMYWSSLTGGVRLEVAEENAEQATEFLRAPLPTELDVDSEIDFPDPTCPKCSSTEVDFVAGTLDDPANTWTCSQCRHQWQMEADEMNG